MLLEHPLFMLCLTLLVFKVSEMVHIKCNKSAILNPVLITIILLVCFLIIFDIPYERYKNDTQILHFMLSPAIVVLAVPLYKNLAQVKSKILLILLAVFISGFGITCSAVLIGQVFDLPLSMIYALTTKSITAPIALEIANIYKTSVPLTIIGVFSTGLSGVILVPYILKVLKVKEEWIQGLILGITAHAFGIARALSISPLAAAFATMGMGLMGAFAVLIVPLVLSIM